MAPQDMAENLIALYEALGAVNVVNAIGTVTGTGTNVLADPTVAAYNTVTLSASGQVPFQLPTPSAGKRLRLLITQDATGSRTASFVTSGTGALTWVGAAAPTLTTTAAHADLITWECYDGTNWIGSAQLNIH